MTLWSRPFVQVRWTAVVALLVWLVGVASALSFGLFPRDLMQLPGLEDAPEFMRPVLEQIQRAMAGPTPFALNQWFGQTGAQVGALLAALFPAIGLGRVLASGVFAYDLTFPLTRVQIGARYLGASLAVFLGSYLVGAGALLLFAPLAGAELPPLWARLGGALAAYWAIHGLGAVAAVVFGDLLRGGGLPVALLLVLALAGTVTGTDWISPLGYLAALAWSDPSALAVTAWAGLGLALHAAALALVSRREA